MSKIVATEPVLFEHRAKWGYLPDGRRGIARGVVVWEGTGTLVLTPTTLYFLYGNKMSRTISYAAVTSAEVGPVRHWEHPPFGNPVSLDHMLIVTTIDDVFRWYGRTDDCDEGCVLYLTDPAHERDSWGLPRPPGETTRREAASRARAVIDEHRGRVDAFGRRDAERRAGLVTRFRPERVRWGWRRDNLPGTGAIDPSVQVQMERVFHPLSESVTRGFHQWTLAALDEAHKPGASNPGFTFLPAESTAWSRDGRWLDYLPAERLSRARPDLNRLLVIDLIDLTFFPGNMAVHSSETVEAAYRLHVDFFDLQPAKPGTGFWYEHAAARPLRDWLVGGNALIESDLRAAVGNVAQQVRLLLSANPAR